VAVAALGLLGISAASAADSMTITSFGGAYQTSQRKTYFEPFAAKTGTKITEEEYNGEIAKIRAMVEANSVTWDVVDVDTQTGQQGCDEGIFEKLDYSRIQPQDKYIERAAQECAVANMVYSTVIAYDGDRIKDGPTTVADFFDVKKFPGKRGLWKNPSSTLELALMGDGVAAKDVYDVLSTPEGIDRAFKKLDSIKKDIVWWEAGQQPPQLLASGEVAMTTVWNGRIYDANKNEGKHFKIVWDGQIQDFDMWVIPKNAKNPDLSYKFIAFANDPAVMANQSKYIPYGPVLKDAIPLIAPDILKDLPTAPENSKNVIVSNAQFWGDNGEELRKRFNTWVAQ
jgi:putative spermidine/putrescine transport system substrate-binding protein